MIVAMVIRSFDNSATNRKPTTPGEILREEFLKPLQLTQIALATHIGCDVKVINRIVNERAGVTAGVALKLAGAFHTSAEFWLNAQQSLDLYEASKQVKGIPKSLLKRTDTVDPSRRRFTLKKQEIA